MSPALRVAVVGSGPAGLYCVQHLLEQCDLAIEVDVIERLPVPFGLVRYGVAPDHQEKKLIADTLFRVVLAQPGVRFLGNVEIGRDVTAAELGEWYDAVILAYGTQGDNRLGVPGEDLPGSATAREFVGWYNGHPDHRLARFDLSGDRVVVVGAGNVALDIARILVAPVADLARTDIADHALAGLRASRVREVVVTARRGWAQSSFGAAELEELERLSDVEIVIEDVPPDALDAPDDSFAQRRRRLLLRHFCDRRVERPRKRVVLRHLVSPLTIQGVARVERIVLGRNRIAAGGRPWSTGERITLSTNLVLRATGFRGRAVHGVPFDEVRGVVPNRAGRITGDDGTVLPGRYVAGWLKRGPSGLIGSNRRCAVETVSALLEDVRGVGRTARPADTVLRELRRRRPDLVEFEDWLALDRAEKRAGALRRVPRVKVTEVDAMVRRLSV